MWLRHIKGGLSGPFDMYASQCYSQEGEDMVLRRIFGDRPVPGFYIDVGAHHPRRFSNTYLFYKQGWRGINVEPNPAVSGLFRRERPADINLTIAISDAPGVRTYYMFDEPALNTFDEERAAAIERERDYRLTEKRPTPLRRLDAVLDEHLPAGQSIAFLSVDVEGHDVEVLASNDWTRYRPAVVLVEALGALFEGSGSSAVDALLRREGYVLFAKTVHTRIFVDTSSSLASKIG